MKKLLTGLFIAALFFCFAHLQAQTTRALKKTLELQMPGTEGSNGGAVAWHAVQKKYYAGMAGNATYPLAVFDAMGKCLSPDDLTTKIDLRSLWYNPGTKSICGNGYKAEGWFSYKLNTKGIPEEHTIIQLGQNQPGEQSVGAYDAKKKFVYFLNGQKVVVYNEEGEELKDSAIALLINIDEEYAGDDEDYFDENFNSTTVVFTGILKNELGLLNYTKPQIELYNINTGAISQILKLPEDALAYDWFNFSFANGIYWLFDKDKRKWAGYK